MVNYLGIIIIPFIALCVLTLLYVFISIGPILAQMLHVELTHIGLLTTFFATFYAFGLLCWGPISDHYGRSRIMIIGLVCLASVTFLILLSTNYYYLLTLRALQGLFAASFPPLAIAWLGEYLAESQRKPAIAMLSCAFMLAGAVGPWYGSVMIHESLFGAMGILLLTYLMGALILYSIQRKIRPLAIAINRVIPPFSLSFMLKTSIQILYTNNLKKVYYSAFLVLQSFLALSMMIPAYMKPDADFTLLRLTTILAMLLSLASAWVFKYIRPAIVLSFALFVMAVTFLILRFLLPHIVNNGSLNLLLIGIYMFFVGAFAFTIPSLITCVMLWASPQSRGLAVSLYACILFIGASLGAFLPTIIPMSWLIPMLSTALFGCAFYVLSDKTLP